MEEKIKYVLFKNLNYYNLNIRVFVDLMDKTVYLGILNLNNFDSFKINVSLRNTIIDLINTIPEYNFTFKDVEKIDNDEITYLFDLSLNRIKPSIKTDIPRIVYKYNEIIVSKEEYIYA